MRLVVVAALVDGVYRRGDVEIDDAGRVAAVGLPGHGRGLAVPGLVDLQVAAISRR
jgi:N-acetylglucosamine-6-phosphate deacetylase